MNEAKLQPSAAASSVATSPAGYTRGGLTFTRRFSTAGISPYDESAVGEAHRLDHRQQGQLDLRAEGS